MGRSYIFILCGLFLIGCVTHRRTSDQASSLSTVTPRTDEQSGPEWLSSSECRDLAGAVNDMALRRNAMPAEWLRRLKPIEVYQDGMNLVIALRRDSHTEVGYYVVPMVSSHMPSGPDRGWSWSPQNSPGYPNSVYVYCREK